MLDFLKRLFSTQQSAPSVIEQAFQTQQKLLEQIVKRQQATIDALVATTDRVVASRYDRPVERTIQPPEDNRLPEFMQMDQGQSRPDLDADSDETFLRSVGVN